MIPRRSFLPPWETSIAHTASEQKTLTDNDHAQATKEGTHNAKKPLEALLNAPGLSGLKTASQITAPPAKIKKPEKISESESESITTTAYAPKEVNKIEPKHWLAIYDALEVKGLLQSTVANCILHQVIGNQFHFLLDQDKGALFDDSHRQRFNDLLNDYFDEPVKVHIDLVALDQTMVTPAAYAENLRQQALIDAVEDMRAEPFVQDLQEHFNAVLDIESIVVSKKL